MLNLKKTCRWVSQINSQNKVIADNNIETSVSGCDDKLPYCHLFGEPMCDEYLSWAKERCPEYCGLCGMKKITRYLHTIGKARYIPSIYQRHSQSSLFSPNKQCFVC